MFTGVDLVKKKTSVSIRDKRILRLRRTRLLEMPGDGDFELKLVSSPKGLREACRLVHDRYVEIGLIDKQKNGIWMTPYQLNPNSRAVIGIMRVKGVPICTATLVCDSEIGIPSERLYPEEIAKLKKQNRRVVEITCLAAKPCREASNAFLHIFKLIGVYAIALGHEDMVISVHPRHARFYEDIFLFEKMGPLKYYPGLKDAPAVLERQDLTTFVKRLRDAYKDLPSYANLYEFFLGKNESFLNKMKKLIKEDGKNRANQKTWSYLRSDIVDIKQIILNDI